MHSHTSTGDDCIRRRLRIDDARSPDQLHYLGYIVTLLRCLVICSVLVSVRINVTFHSGPLGAGVASAS